MAVAEMLLHKYAPQTALNPFPQSAVCSERRRTATKDTARNTLLLVTGQKYPSRVVRSCPRPRAELSLKGSAVLASDFRACRGLLQGVFPLKLVQKRPRAATPEGCNVAAVNPLPATRSELWFLDERDQGITLQGEQISSLLPPLLEASPSTLGIIPIVGRFAVLCPLGR